MPDVVPPASIITSNLLTYRSPFVVAHAVLTGNSAAINSPSEVTIVTTSSAQFVVGRAYRFTYQGLVQHSAANVTDLVYLRLRRGGGGGLIRNMHSVVVANKGTASRNVALDLSVVGTPAATITDTVSLTASWESGSSATFTFSATASTPGLLTVWDIGPASDMPGIGTF